MTSVFMEKVFCPVCLQVHDYGAGVVFIPEEKGKQVAHIEPKRPSLCKNHIKRYSNGFIAVVECKGEIKLEENDSIRDLNTTGRIAYVYPMLLGIIFDTDPPPLEHTPAVYVNEEGFEHIKGYLS